MGTFPTLDATALDGRPWHLPADLARTAVVILAFRRWQQVEVDGWISELDALGCPHPIFEVPTIGRAYRLARPFIDGGMRTGIPDPVVRARTLTVYTDVGRVLDALGLRSDEHVVATRVEPDGGVTVCHQGTFTAEVARALVAP